MQELRRLASVTLAPGTTTGTGHTRNRKTGQYSYSGDMTRLCTCGHTLGTHAAEAPHDCFAGDDGVTSCDCGQFRPARAKL
jgi:hypothetical protein